MQGVTVTLEELLALRNVANQINLPQQKVTGNSQQGNFQSRFRGRGMDFVETRIYQPGDDIRSINWAVTARTGKPHTKIYQQERDRPIYLIVDFNPSMFFGTRTAFKSVIAAKAATLIAWAGLRNGDRVGALLLKDNFQILPPCHRKQSVIELFKQLVNFVVPNSESLVDYASAFRRLKKTIKSGSLVYFISDFYNMNDILQNELQQLAKVNEVINLLIYDDLEKNPPQAGRYLFHDNVSAQSLLADTRSKSFCSEYGEIFTERLREVKRLCYRTGMQMAEISTQDDLVKILRQVLNRKM